ncbi:MAG: hypothetical protein UU16_C0037G0001, partial [Candidatus Woesebacteria bacterium GW2011_GWA2_40_7]
MFSRTPEKRGRDIKRICKTAAEVAGYPQDKFRFHFAEKANFKAPVVAAALKELHMETSGELGLHNFMWLRSKGLIAQDKKVICNGPKLRVHRFDKGYAETIIEAFEKGLDITPVLVQGESDFFRRNVRKGRMSVGIRSKFAVLEDKKQLPGVVSPFGFDWEGVQNEAAKIAASPNLKFTMLHAMSSAASAVNPEAFAKSALIAAEQYAVLKRKYPTLTDLNLGGGFPSIDSGYKHQEFLVPFLRGVKNICERYGVELPTIVIESGSFIATNCEHLVYPITNTFINSSDGIPWLELGGNLLNIPDLWIQEDSFNFIPANNANSPLTRVRFHDLSCDSNSTVPTKEQLTANPRASVVMTNNFKGLVVAAPCIGAYQDVLGGVGNPREQKIVNHCGLPEPVQVYIWK